MPVQLVKEKEAPVQLFDHGQRIVCQGCLAERMLPPALLAHELGEYWAIFRDFAHEHRGCLEVQS